MRTPILLLLLGLLAGCGTAGSGRVDRPGETRMRIAAAAEAAGEPARAAAILGQEVLRRPADAELRLRHAAALSAIGEYPAAAQTLADGIQQVGRNRRLVLALALARLHTGDIELASTDLEALAADAGADAQVLTGLGVARDMQERHAEAQVLYRQVLARAPGNVAARNNLGLSLALSGRAGEAIAVLDPLSRTQAGASRKVRHNLALAHGAAGDEATAISILSQDLSDEDATVAARAFTNLGVAASPAASAPSAVAIAAAARPAQSVNTDADSTTPAGRAMP